MVLTQTNVESYGQLHKKAKIIMSPEILAGLTNYKIKYEKNKVNKSTSIQNK